MKKNIKGVNNSLKHPKKKISFKKLPIIGIWKDREDMQDSVKWVNDLRRREGSSDYNL